MFTTKDLATHFRVTVRTINRWVKLGKLEPPVKTPGGHNRWPHIPRQEK